MIPNQKTKPNVVVFLTDQQRWDTSGLHGNPLDLMPNFDLMAQEGTHLFNCFTCHPVCGPARASLQTGLYSTNTGVYKNGIALPLEKRTLAHYFKSAGYKTAYIGKWHLADSEPVKPLQQGDYDYWLGANALERTSEPYHTVLYDNKCNLVELPGYRVDAVTDAAIRYINDNKTNPFFLFISHLEPHSQNSTDEFASPNGYRERYDGKWIPQDLATLNGNAHQHLGGYYGSVKRLDEAFGRLLDALTSLNLIDKTIVLFTSDHGCHFKTRNKAYKQSCHESSIRVPTAIIGPGFHQGGRIRELVNLVDLPPTLLDAVGINIPEEMEGRSLLPLINGKRENWPDDLFVQFSGPHVGRMVRTNRWKYSVISKHKDGAYPEDDNYTEEYLYDLKTDPYELTNLIHFTVYDKVKEVMQNRLLKWIKKVERKNPIIEKAEVHPPIIGGGCRCIKDAEACQ